MELEVEKISLELQRVRLEPADILVVRVPDGLPAEGLRTVRNIMIRGLEEAGLKNQVIVMPASFELSAVAG